ncbi:MAG TPA: glycosyl hydrolase [Polyangiaceae bacterium]
MKYCILLGLSLLLAGCGGGGPSGIGDSSNALKGVAFSTTSGDCADLNRLGLSWYYNWSGSTKCAGPEFVPQIWGSWQKLQWVHTPAETVASGARELLGFNEPDGSEQSNIAVDEALRLWPDMQQPGVLLGSPATAAQTWEESFMTAVSAQQLRVDFIAMHWYGWDPGSCDNVSSLEAKIQWAERWQRPIWITEWSCRAQAATVVQKFYADALVMFKAHPLVQRYAWFLTRSASDPAQTDFSDATLLDQSGAPSALGNEYIRAPAAR